MIASPEEIKQYLRTYVGIQNPCPRCLGSGRHAYANTATWRGGVGGSMVTTDICDSCWGSGDKDKSWTNLKLLDILLRKIRECNNDGGCRASNALEVLKLS